MQNYSSSTVPLVDIVLAVVVLTIAFFLLFKIIRLFSERPDIAALLSIVAMFIGYGLLVVADNNGYIPTKVPKEPQNKFSEDCS